MKNLWKKIINITGLQYFLTSLFSVPIFIGGFMVFGDFLFYLEKYLRIDTLLVWGIIIITTYVILSIKGVIALFKTPFLKDRTWVWLGLVINLFILYILLFAGSDLPLPLI